MGAAVHHAHCGWDLCEHALEVAREPFGIRKDGSVGRGGIAWPARRLVRAIPSRGGVGVYTGFHCVADSGDADGNLDVGSVTGGRLHGESRSVRFTVGVDWLSLASRLSCCLNRP